MMAEQLRHEEFMKQAMAQSDVIVKPSHYEQYEFEPVAFIMKNELSFWMGNVIKYVMRAGDKEGTPEIEDLEKAKRYIDMRINQLEGREPNAS
tara:strand:+ start:245 stop:523 length:279 start_codon:yes stop_codon:yes gene_type:complete